MVVTEGHLAFRELREFRSTNGLICGWIYAVVFGAIGLGFFAATIHEAMTASSILNIAGTAVLSVGCLWVPYTFSVQLATSWTDRCIVQGRFITRQIPWSEFESVTVYAPKVVIASASTKITLYLLLYEDAQALLDAIHDLMTSAIERGDASDGR